MLSYEDLDPDYRAPIGQTILLWLIIVGFGTILGLLLALIVMPPERSQKLIDFIF